MCLRPAAGGIIARRSDALLQLVCRRAMDRQDHAQQAELHDRWHQHPPGPAHRRLHGRSCTRSPGRAARRYHNGRPCGDPRASRQRDLARDIAWQMDGGRARLHPSGGTAGSGGRRPAARAPWHGRAHPVPHRLQAQSASGAVRKSGPLIQLFCILSGSLTCGCHSWRPGLAGELGCPAPAGRNYRVLAPGRGLQWRLAL